MSTCTRKKTTQPCLFRISPRLVEHPACNRQSLQPAPHDPRLAHLLMCHKNQMSRKRKTTGFFASKALSSGLN